MPIDTRQNRDRVRTVSFYAALAVVTYLLWVVTQPFLLALCAAATLVVYFYPWHEQLERRYGSAPAAMASTLAVTTILIVPTALVLTIFIREATAAVGSVQRAMDDAGGIARVNEWWTWVQQRAPLLAGYRLTDLVGDVGRYLAGSAASLAGDALRNLGSFVFDMAVVIFGMFFLFRDARPIMATIRRVLPFEPGPREQVLLQARDLIRASVVASIAVASAQGAAGGLLFWSVGIAAPVFWGVLMAFFSLLPLVGAWIIWLPAAIWFLVTGSIGKGLVVLALGTGVVSVIDNVLRPALLAGRAQMNGLLVLISLLGGLSAFGLIGIVVGPVIVATMASLLSAYTTPASDTASDDGPAGA